MAEHCVAFITSPESFITCDTNPKCIAKATMPMTSLVFGKWLKILLQDTEHQLYMFSLMVCKVFKKDFLKFDTLIEKRYLYS